MWKCLNCETMNDGEVCVICGDAKPTPEQLEAIRREEEAQRAEEMKNNQSQNEVSQTPTPVAPAPVPTPVPAPAPATTYTPAADGTAPFTPPRKKRTGLIVTIIILSLVILGILGFGAYYFINNNAEEEEVISSEQTMYDEALALLEDGKFEEAKEKFEDLGSFSDSENMVKECDYKFAESKADDRKYLEAYELYESLDDYKESETKKNNLQKDVYSEGVEYYKLKKYKDAKTRFEKIDGYKRSGDYLLLIDAHNDDIYNISTLYDILDLEDAKDIIINNDEYAESFLKGYWEAYDGSYIRFYTEDGSNICGYNISAPEGDGWVISDGIHYMTNGSSRSKAWAYTIVDSDTITIYNYTTSSTTTMYRQ